MSLLTTDPREYCRCGHPRRDHHRPNGPCMIAEPQCPYFRRDWSKWLRVRAPKQR